MDDFLSGNEKLVIAPPYLALGKVLRLMILREWETALTVACQESLKFPTYRQLQQMEVFCRLCVNQVAMADISLQKIDFDRKPNQHLYWLKTWVALKKGSREMAQESLSACLGRNAEETEVNEGFLLRLWDTAPTFGSRPDLAYFFPILPSLLTGLPNDVVRMEYGPSVISQMHSHQPKSSQAKLRTAPLPILSESKLLIWLLDGRSIKSFWEQTACGCRYCDCARRGIPRISSTGKNQVLL